MTTCVLCGKEIPSLANAYRRVTGFERQRHQGGTNAIRLRELSDEWAHAFCIDREAHNVNANQMGLTG